PPAPFPDLEIPMPSAIPAGATGGLPPAARIDPRGHRFGAGVSAVLLIAAFLSGQVWIVPIVLLSIGVSAAFGLRYSIYGIVCRRRRSATADPRRAVWRRCRAPVPALRPSLHDYAPMMYSHAVMAAVRPTPSISSASPVRDLACCCTPTCP